ncbi:hypothetical protein GCM10023085_26910 [Actinomadura viridis]|uniref:Uncharacterized protein n=1 Tax=Actinomadura viridis TaxID=58110 RepID=A0A931DDT1_9ACTN|nr:hypothetical protein [Actinomadura viridis]MBG6087322.1 hypothetical protein [Actinomadura viridis]
MSGAGSGKKSGAQAPKAAGGGSSKAGCGFLVGIFLLVFVLPVLWGMYDEGVFDGDDRSVETAPVFGPRDAGRLVEQLSTAAKAQGVCYGWVVDSGRYRTIPKVIPSYSGTFRPETPVPAPSTPVAATTAPRTPRPGVTPAPRGTATGPRSPEATGRPVPRTTRPVPRTTRATPRPTESDPLEQLKRIEIERELRDLDDPGVEYGSNLGVGVDPRQVPAQCPRWVVLTADYFYSSSDQEWTYGSFDFDSSFRLSSGADDEFKRMLAQSDSDGIHGDHPIARLADAIGGMPMLVAEKGLAPPVPAPAAQQAPPAGDRLSASNTGRNIFVGIGIALIAGGVAWIGIAAVRNRRSSSS